MSSHRRTNWHVINQDFGNEFRWRCEDGDLVAEWPGILTLRATAEGELKGFRAAVGASPEIVEKTRNGVARAFLRSRSGRPSLHGSAVVEQGQALVCVGPSGVGKSTIANRFCTRRGVELLADDVVAVDHAGDVWHVLPSESALWLAGPGSTTKAPVRPPRAAQSRALLRVIACLEFDDSASGCDVRPLRGAEAFSALLAAFTRFERSGAASEGELEVISSLAGSAHLLRVVRSRKVPAEAVVDALLALQDQVMA